MKLNIEFPNTLLSKIVIDKEFIPCLCKISYDFEIEFRDPLQEAIGVVSEWDRELIEERAPSNIGGEYTHYLDGEISIEWISGNIYKILDLRMFYPDYGWCPIVKSGHYAAPKHGLSREE